MAKSHKTLIRFVDCLLHLLAYKSIAITATLQDEI